MLQLRPIVWPSIILRASSWSRREEGASPSQSNQRADDPPPTPRSQDPLSHSCSSLPLLFPSIPYPKPPTCPPLHNLEIHKLHPFPFLCSRPPSLFAQPFCRALFVSGTTAPHINCHLSIETQTDVPRAWRTAFATCPASPPPGWPTLTPLLPLAPIVDASTLDSSINRCSQFRFFCAPFNTTVSLVPSMIPSPLHLVPLLPLSCKFLHAFLRPESSAISSPPCIPILFCRARTPTPSPYPFTLGSRPDHGLECQTD